MTITGTVRVIKGVAVVVWEGFDGAERRRALDLDTRTAFRWAGATARWDKHAPLVWKLTKANGSTRFAKEVSA